MPERQLRPFRVAPAALREARIASLWLAASALLLSGCGFHLEGRVPLPQSIRRPYIEAPDQQSDFVQSLRRQMLISGAHPVDSRDEATAVVDILDDAVTRRVLSVTAQNRPA